MTSAVTDLNLTNKQQKGRLSGAPFFTILLQTTAKLSDNLAIVWTIRR